METGNNVFLIVEYEREMESRKTVFVYVDIPENQHDLISLIQQ